MADSKTRVPKLLPTTLVGSYPQPDWLKEAQDDATLLAAARSPFANRMGVSSGGQARASLRAKTKTSHSSKTFRAEREARRRRTPCIFSC